MEGCLNPYFRLFGGWVFPYISRIHTAHIDEYLHFRYLKCLVIIVENGHILGVYSVFGEITLSNMNLVVSIGILVMVYEIIPT